MTLQEIVFLIKARKVQRTEDGVIFINDHQQRLETVTEKGVPSISQKISKASEQLQPMLRHLELNGLVAIEGDCYFSLTYSGYHYVQMLLSSIGRFLLTSVAVPIAVSVLTTLITLWVTD